MSLAEQVQAARTPAVVIRGPAACGKTTAVVAVYRHLLDPSGRPTALLLAPNAPAVRHLRRILLAGSPGHVAVAPGVLTFAALAGRVLAAPASAAPGSPQSRQTARPMSAFRRHLLLARIVADLHADGALAALGAVADTPGLVVALDRAIAELKRAAIEPEDLAKAVGKAHDKRSDLVAVYTRYQRCLQDQGAFDTEGQMWLARERLRSAAADQPLPGLEGVAAVIADGFTDFTSTQLDILAMLSRRVGRVVITLPLADDGRRRMWHWTARTLQRIRTAFGADLEEIVAEPDPPGGGVLPPTPPLWDCLFNLDASAPRPSGPAGLAVVAASGVDAEVAAAARRVKRLLRDGAPAGSVAVLARGLDAYAEPIRRIFAEHDIPVAEAPADLTDVPIIQFALDVASLAPALEWRAVLRVIRNSYFRPQALGDFDAATVIAAEALIREGNVLGGRQAYADAAVRLADRARRLQAQRRDGGAAEDGRDDVAAGVPTPHQPTPEAFAQAAAMLHRLFDIADRAATNEEPAPQTDPFTSPSHVDPDLKKPSHPNGWASDPCADPRTPAAPADMNPKKPSHPNGWASDPSSAPVASVPPAGLAAAVDGLALHAAALEHGDPELVARDLRALAALSGCLSELRRDGPTSEGRPVRRSLGEGGPPVRRSLGEGGPPVRRSLGEGGLRQALQAVRCPPARHEAVVDVLDVLDARAIRYRHVLLLGLSEGQFPPRLAEGSLLGEDDRLRWQRQGIELDSRRDLMAREMLLFYLAASRADETLTLSYLQADAGGRVGSPSPFLLSLLAPCGGLEAPGLLTRVPPGPYLPPPADLASRRDAFNAALAGQFAQLPADYAGLLGWAAHAAGPKLLRSAMGMVARHRRWQAGPCDEFDGRLTDPALLAALARRYPGQTIFSAERLNTYGQCPWQYFAQYVLHLAPLAEPQRRLEPQNRGTFCHQVLCELMKSLKAAAGQAGHVRLAEVPAEDLQAALARTVEEVAAQAERFGLPYPALWRVQLDQMHRDLSDYLQAAREMDGLRPEGLCFELAFGQEPASAAPERPGGADPASRDEPVVLATPAGELRFRGRIDRVDRIAYGDVTGLLVVDYKTGRLPTDADLAAGRNLQMPLYAAAAEAILGEHCVGGVFHHLGQTTGRFERFFAAVTAAKGAEPYKEDDNYEQKLQAAMETIGRFVRQMAAGQFDALPTHDCPSYCPFRTMCQFSPARAERKTPAGGGPGEGDTTPAPETPPRLAAGDTPASSSSQAPRRRKAAKRKEGD